MPDSAVGSAPGGPTVSASPRVLDRVEDALRLLEFAVSSGFRKDGQPIKEDILRRIKTVAGKLGVFDPPPDNPENSVFSVPSSSKYAVTIDEWIDFESAYYELAQVMSPITAETLLNTERTSGDTATGLWEKPGPKQWQQQKWSDRFERAVGFLLGYSPAQRFARVLAFLAIGCAIAIIYCEYRLTVLGQDEDATTGLGERTILKLLVPWIYGGLGSCVYLLKSAHYFIHERCFDLRRKSEYVNRVLLGFIAGGAIILFANQLVGDEGTVIQLGTAALGFLAGYSTDFLFNTIERVIAAIFPKVPPAEAQARRSPRPAARPDGEEAPPDKPNKPDGKPGQSAGGPRRGRKANAPSRKDDKEK